MDSKKNQFESLTVFVLASNETESLNNTVSRIRALKYYEDICRVVLVVKSADCPAYTAGEKIVAAYDEKI